MEKLMREGEREFLRLKDKYADYIFDGQNYCKVIEDKLTVVPAPADMEEYKYFRFQVMMESPLAGNYGGIGLAYVLRDYAHEFEQANEDQISWTGIDFERISNVL